MSMFKQVERFDTSNKELNDVNYEITRNILRILNESTSERIGYLSCSNLDEKLPITFSYASSIQNNLSLEFDVRSKVESSEDKVQLIPILVITNKKRNKVFVVKKNKKQTSEHSPEADKLLIYLGGHIREEDIIHSNGAYEDILSIVGYALHREIKEETGIDFFPLKDEIDPLCIWIRTNDRSKKHLAICHIMEANFDALKVKLDKNEFITTGRTKSGKVFDLKDISSHYNELEEWSQIILKEIFKHKPRSEQLSLIA